MMLILVVLAGCVLLPWLCESRISIDIRISQLSTRRASLDNVEILRTVVNVKLDAVPLAQ
jgi:hypothetical protein